MRHAVILAGGSGTRLWPASRRARPKQLLAIGASNEPLVVSAICRGKAVSEHTVIVTARDLVEQTRPLAPGDTIIAEPVGRNTAAAIGYAAALIEARDPNAVLVILPADQYVADEPGLARAIETAMTAVDNDDAIATIAIPPTRPETGFGYIEVAPDDTAAVRRVVRFVEKPDRATAERYVASGRHFWNAGIFIASARRLLAELDVHLPVTAAAMRELARVDPKELEQHAARIYPTLPSISIDHAVMEKASGVVTVPAAVGWDDVGSWASLPAIRGVDATGNTTVGTALVIDGTGNVVVSDDDTLVATVGLDDFVVVKSGNAILVIRKDQAQDVRKVIDALSARGLARYL
ncbi:MAG: Mannose-phosphate guanylyltransferase [Myxococcales bacterium]|nr:Mannose-phosphate guanylyltransferase [Myxococcales bacterium]